MQKIRLYKQNAKNYRKVALYNSESGNNCHSHC